MKGNEHVFHTADPSQLPVHDPPRMSLVPELFRATAVPHPQFISQKYTPGWPRLIALGSLSTGAAKPANITTNTPITTNKLEYQNEDRHISDGSRNSKNRYVSPNSSSPFDPPRPPSLFFIFFFLFGQHPAVLTGLHSEITWCLGDHTGHQELNPSWLHAR